MKWIMTSERVRGDDAGVHFFIGSLCVAQVKFFRGKDKGCLLVTLDHTSEHKSVSEAMKEMHRKLGEAKLEAEVEV
jgi:hypothetical protein